MAFFYSTTGTHTGTSEKFCQNFEPKLGILKKEHQKSSNVSSDWHRG